MPYLRCREILRLDILAVWKEAQQLLLNLKTLEQIDRPFTWHRGNHLWLLPQLAYRVTKDSSCLESRSRSLHSVSWSA